ncbi:Arginine N-methyltransferase 2 [Lasiodiplodia theobromae]|uniref:Arginine N-methyltransferase 2 n=1 Tax=Lasiodiplodia theobromae TaxID=45133 RepID=A0A5N5DPV9_9PEZI|nr:Arginine n-methyltransferase 2 [Lasiodiplodia theobromae]KAB2579986.1 Protein arginine N-methyltransferase 2 [Lasiodiplodia theobromae]KAF4540896.1 Arginine n-methyltransferase 2 [Lasiodiplodia theobromae]KAF9634620.1 Arginine N-methyltransferase 2 [Lasiodiplodia theobromae]
MMEGIEVDTDLSTHSLLLAAANHDVAALRDLLRNTSANVQDEDTGYTPLHAAVAAFEPEPEEEKPQDGDQQQTNGHAAEAKPQPSEEDLEKATKAIKLLMANGAIWNDLDNNGETPGCIAARLGLKDIYGLFVDAGVRAELLLSRLDEYQILGDNGESDGEEDEDEGDGEEIQVVEGEEMEGYEVVQEESSKGEDLSASGVVVEADEGKKEEGGPANPDVKSAEYLASQLTFEGDRLLDADKNGVMMAWETSIMQRSADLLLPKEGLRVLNVGHGMGIIDRIIQEKKPAEHHIIEAHPAVVKRMKEEGWTEKKGVSVHEGKWQDVVEDLVAQNITFDAIYFDTFAEDYKALREFFSEYVIGLLDSEGRFGFFNGLGADRKICYDVYTKVVEMDLFEAGFDTEWEEIPIPDLDANGEWEGVRRKYWVLDTYRLPTCKFIG